MFTFTHVAGQYDKTVTRAVLSPYKWDAFISVELCIELGDPRSGSSLTENAATTSFSAVVNVTLPAKINRRGRLRNNRIGSRFDVRNSGRAQSTNEGS